MRIIAIIVIIILFLQGCIYNEKRPETIYTPEKPEAIYTPEYLQGNNDDRQTLAQISLEWAILDKNIPDYNLIKDKNSIILSTRNINKSYIFSLKDITIIILTPEEIKQKSEEDGDFLYFEFGMIDIQGTDATVKLGNIWAQSEKSRKKIAYLSGGGATIPFMKQGDKWIRKNVTEIWIS